MTDKKVFPRVKDKPIHPKKRWNYNLVDLELRNKMFKKYGNSSARSAWIMMAILFGVINANLLWNAADKYVKDASPKAKIVNMNGEVLKDAARDVYVTPKVLVLVAPFLLMACIIIGFGRVKHSAVDVMLVLKKYGKEYNLDSRTVERTVKLAPSIIANMSADDRVYFEMLMSGNIEIAKDSTFRDMATEIILGHLQSHPEDAKRVISVFDEKTIPSDLLTKINKITENQK